MSEQTDWKTYRMDPDIEAQSSQFTPEELVRLKSYRGQINAVSSDEKYATGVPTGGRVMAKPLGQVLGDNIKDYIKLTSKLELPKSNQG